MQHMFSKLNYLELFEEGYRYPDFKACLDSFIVDLFRNLHKMAPQILPSFSFLFL